MEEPAFQGGGGGLPGEGPGDQGLGEEPEAPARPSGSRGEGSLRRLVLSPWGRALILLLPVLLLWAGVELWSRRGRTGLRPGPLSGLPASPEPSPTPTPTLHPAIAAYLELERLREKAFRELRPELLDEVYHPEAPQLADEKRRLEEWRKKGYRLEGQYLQVVEVLVAAEDPGLRLTGLYVRTRYCGLRLVDPRGRVLDTSTPGVEEASHVDLFQSPSGGKWLIMGVSDASGMPPPPRPVSRYLNLGPLC